MGSDPDLAIAALARRQHGVWSRQQALAAGLSPTMIRTRLRHGTWVPLDAAVYAHIVSDPTWERSLMSAIVAEPWAVASHRSAAVLHELEGFRPGRPEITIPSAANARSRLAIVHRGVDVRTMRVRGIPAVALDQVFVDLSQVAGMARVRDALAQKAAARPWLVDAVRDRYCLLAPRGGRNLRPLRDVLDGFGTGELPTTSQLEAVLREVAARPGVPRVQWEAPFPGRQPGAQRVDGLIPAWSVVLEGDGRAWHTRVEDFERDRRRDAEAAAAGFQTLRFTWHQLRDEAAWVHRVLVETGARRVAA